MKNRDPDENGWETSAPAWIARTGDKGDYARAHVLDKIMLERSTQHHPKNALDIGCGEGRFCRMLAQNDIVATGIDPVAAMIEEAQRLHPAGTYIEGYAEHLDIPDESFDLVVSYLALIDIDDITAAISEMARVLNPGGHIIVANLTGFSTSSAPYGKRICRETGEVLRPIGTYLEERRDWFEWDGVRVQNWHRPLSRYMKLFLQAGLKLSYFDEPEPHSGPQDRLDAYRQMPFLMAMEWQKPR
ncbi:MAG: class I SAM-dependent methyltransferase [Hyphomicrobiales bacterium]